MLKIDNPDFNIDFLFNTINLIEIYIYMNIILDNKFQNIQQFPPKNSQVILLIYGTLDSTHLNALYNSYSWTYIIKQEFLKI